MSIWGYDLCKRNPFLSLVGEGKADIYASYEISVMIEEYKNNIVKAQGKER